MSDCMKMIAATVDQWKTGAMTDERAFSIIREIFSDVILRAATPEFPTPEISVIYTSWQRSIADELGLDEAAA